MVTLVLLPQRREARHIFLHGMKVDDLISNCIEFLIELLNQVLVRCFDLVLVLLTVLLVNVLHLSFLLESLLSILDELVGIFAYLGLELR